MATTIGAVPLAYSVPGGDSQMMQTMRVAPYRTTYDYADGYVYVGDIDRSYYFGASSWGDKDGPFEGSVYVARYDPNTSIYDEIYCYGPEYADALFVDPTNGNATVNATLDPSDSNCSSTNVLEPMILDISGQADGYYSGSSAGVDTSRYPDATYSYLRKVDDYSEAFSGSNGFYDGSFSGYVSSSRYRNWQKVK